MLETVDQRSKEQRCQITLLVHGPSGRGDAAHPSFGC